MTAPAAAISAGDGRRSLLGRVSTALYLHPGLLLFLLLTPPLLWLGVVYLGSLFSLLLQSFFHIDGFTGLVVREFTLRTYGDLLTPANLSVIWRTVGMAALEIGRASCRERVCQYV